jgi:hypothetical protein
MLGYGAVRLMSRMFTSEEKCLAPRNFGDANDVGYVFADPDCRWSNTCAPGLRCAEGFKGEPEIACERRDGPPKPFSLSGCYPADLVAREQSERHAAQLRAARHRAGRGPGSGGHKPTPEEMKAARTAGQRPDLVAESSGKAPGVQGPWGSGSTAPGPDASADGRAGPHGAGADGSTGFRTGVGGWIGPGRLGTVDERTPAPRLEAGSEAAEDPDKGG